MWATMKKSWAVWLGGTAYLFWNRVVLSYWTSVLVLWTPVHLPSPCLIPIVLNERANQVPLWCETHPGLLDPDGVSSATFSWPIGPWQRQLRLAGTPGFRLVRPLNKAPAREYLRAVTDPDELQICLDVPRVLCYSWEILELVSLLKRHLFVYCATWFGLGVSLKTDHTHFWTFLCLETLDIIIIIIRQLKFSF